MERKNVNVTITVAKNERNVELTDSMPKKKSERTKLKSGQGSPSRLSAKERLGDKVEDEPIKVSSSKHMGVERSHDGSHKGETSLKSRSPRIRSKDHHISISDSPMMPISERKVYIEDRKKKKMVCYLVFCLIITVNILLLIKIN